MVHLPTFLLLLLLQRRCQTRCRTWQEQKQPAAAYSC
jgi:hypothetical protein